MLYNSEDGGQTNVEVDLVCEMTYENTKFLIIKGPTLIGTVKVNGQEMMIVHPDCVTDHKLANIVQLRP